jgi:beta-glucanase (GH16 family)
VLDQPFYVILNLAVGGHFDGDPQSDAIFPATMLVDYVRVFRAQPQSP